MAYDILQLASQAALKAVQYGRSIAAARRIPTGLWIGPIHRAAWTLDFCGWNGMQCMVRTEAGWTPPFRRPPGTWHLYAPGVQYRELQDRPELQLEDAWLIFDLPKRHALFKPGLFAALHDPEDVLAPRVRALYALQQRGEPGAALAAHGLFLSLLGEVALAARRGRSGLPQAPWPVRNPESPSAAETESLLERLDALVCKRLANPPGLDELAEALNLSVSTLAHRFKAETGMTVVDRVRWLRVRAARGLLGRPGASVKSVAQELGFSSTFYFSRVFKEVAGIAPQACLRHAQTLRKRPEKPDNSLQTLTRAHPPRPGRA